MASAGDSTRPSEERSASWRHQVTGLFDLIERIESFAAQFLSLWHQRLCCRHQLITKSAQTGAGLNSPAMLAVSVLTGRSTLGGTYHAWMHCFRDGLRQRRRRRLFSRI